MTQNLQKLLSSIDVPADWVGLREVDVKVKGPGPLLLEFPRVAEVIEYEPVGNVGL